MTLEFFARPAQTIRRFAEELRREYPGMLPMGTESCSNFDRCTYPDAPCVGSLGASSPMEAYGMLVSEVCRANGMQYYSGKGTIAYTACFLLK